MVESTRVGHTVPSNRKSLRVNLKYVYGTVMDKLDKTLIMMSLIRYFQILILFYYLKHGVVKIQHLT